MRRYASDFHMRAGVLFARVPRQCPNEQSGCRDTEHAAQHALNINNRHDSDSFLADFDNRKGTHGEPAASTAAPLLRVVGTRAAAESVHDSSNRNNRAIADYLRRAKGDVGFAVRRELVDHTSQCASGFS
jgi:hypothetical protein